MSKRKRSLAALALEGVVYRLEGGLRHVVPYDYVYTTHAKQRWFGRSVLDVFSKEFGDRTPAYYETAIGDGRITISGARVEASRLVKMHDKLEHAVLRTEPPVVGGTLRVLTETDEYVAVEKPATIPVHPCGGYRCNSLLYILAREHGLDTLRPLHRLDRLTSGLVVFAKTADFATRFTDAMRTHRVAKTYYARVTGAFPASAAEEAAMRAARSVEAEASEAASASALPPPPTFSATRWEEEGSDDGDDDGDAAATATGAAGTAGTVVFECPLGVVSHKEGRHGFIETGKEATTSFRRIALLRSSNASAASPRSRGEVVQSIVECKPLTGRTHQIRLHLLALGFPIANDPNYNAEGAAARVAHQDLLRVRIAARDGTAGESSSSSASAFTAPLEGMHSEGIWLHAKRYVGAGVSLEAPDPAWLALASE